MTSHDRKQLRHTTYSKLRHTVKGKVRDTTASGKLCHTASKLGHTTGKVRHATGTLYDKQITPCSGVLRMQKLRTPLVGAKGYQKSPLFTPGVGI